MSRLTAALLAIALGLMAPSPARAVIGDELGFSPYWDWRTLETEHFRLTFPDTLEPVARKAAAHLEDAHAILTRTLHWTPALRTQVVLVDNSDSANGLATAVDRLGMVLITTPPETWFSTGYYEDWLRLLCFHEYTHFVNMDTTYDFYQPLRYLFGNVLLPNSVWPPWMLEGLAVYMETWLTRGGRGRSPYYEMVLRAAVEDGALNRGDYVTLDRVNGENPWHPGGETRYLFGYQLWNQVAATHGVEALGEVNKRSGRRIPFFINGNMKNVTGEEWYGFWDEFVDTTSKRMTTDLAKIRKQPLTPVERLTSWGYGALGPAVSPDGSKVAYTHDSLDQRIGLYVRDTRTGEVRRHGDKLLGVGMAFLPDSRRLVYSALQRETLYETWSDLRWVDTETGKQRWLSQALRARDPDVSRDGKLVVFTQIRSSTAVLAAAPLLDEDGSLSLGPVRVLHVPAPLGRVTNPKISPDGKRVVFSLHTNGENAEDLYEISVDGGEARPLVHDGRYNRFPAFDEKGRLHFVSDATGVDNVYRLDAGKPQLVSNVTTGLWTPAFGPGGETYASVFGVRGWDLARVKLASAPVSSQDAKVAPPPAPKYAEEASLTSPNIEKVAKLETKDYSVFPSLWPRQWAPILGIGRGGTYLGGQVSSFDAIDRHFYILAAAYDSITQQGDYFALYSNRRLGPTLTFTYSEQTDQTYFVTGTDTLDAFVRKREFSASIARPIRYTFSTLVPSLAMEAERKFAYEPQLTGSSRYVPNVSGRLTYSDAESSKLDISTERGRVTTGGVRAYFDSGTPSYKLLLSDTEHFVLPKDSALAHTVLVPSVRGSYVSRVSSFTDANVLVQGRRNRLLDPIAGDSFDELGIRGYPFVTISTRAAAVGSLDYRFPIRRIFRGWGTNPLYLDNFYGFVFGEAAVFPSAKNGPTLASAGGGLRLSTELLIHIPLVLSAEFHQGFNDGFGGTGELFFALNLGSFNF